MSVAVVLLCMSIGACAGVDERPLPNTCESVMIEHVRGAAALARLAAAHHAEGLGGSFSATYQGTISVEAHMMRPGMVRTVPMLIGLAVDPSTGYMTLRERRGEGEAASTRTTIIRGERVAVQPAESAPFTELRDGDAAAAIASAQWWSPVTISRRMAAAAGSCRRADDVALDGIELAPLTYVDSAGRSCTALLDPQHRIVRVERLFASQWRGDACDWVRFDAGGMPGTPQAITRFGVLDDVTVRYDLTLHDGGQELAPNAPGSLPAEREADVPDWNTPDATPLEFVVLSEGVTAIEDAAADVRLLVVEREADLVVLSAPCGDAVSTRFINAIRERFPGRAIGTVSIGHHHPASSGGLRAWAAAGAEIVSPRGLEAHVRGHLELPTTLGRPAIGAPRGARLRLFDERTSIECPSVTIELIDIKERSRHAFHYTVAHLKGPGILFEDDLGYFPISGATSAGPRLIGLTEALAEEGITPQRLVQQWPVKGVVREVAWETVLELVEAAKAVRSK